MQFLYGAVGVEFKQKASKSNENSMIKETAARVLRRSERPLTRGQTHKGELSRQDAEKRRCSL
jgi:hypothetical protein